MLQLPNGSWINPQQVVEIRHIYFSEKSFAVQIYFTNNYSVDWEVGEEKEAVKQRDSIAQQIRDYLYPEKP